MLDLFLQKGCTNLFFNTATHQQPFYSLACWIDRWN